MTVDVDALELLPAEDNGKTGIITVDTCSPTCVLGTAFEQSRMCMVEGRFE